MVAINVMGKMKIRKEGREGRREERVKWNKEKREGEGERGSKEGGKEERSWPFSVECRTFQFSKFGAAVLINPWKVEPIVH